MIAKIELIALTKQYNTLSPILNCLTYSFLQGTSYAITGASGSGKSTLLHLISLLDTPTSGDILFNGHKTSRFSQYQRAVHAQKNIGIVLQNPHLLADITLLENIMLPGLIAQIPYKQCVKRAQELLDLVMLTEWADHLPWQVSGGQQQRAALARALFHNPAFILADEPTGNLDAHTGAVIIQLLQQYQTEHGAGLLISTHDQTLAHRMNVICTIKNGTLSIVEQAPTAHQVPEHHVLSHAA